MFSSRLLTVVLCILSIKVVCASASCSDYDDDVTCNFRGTQSCKYTGTTCAYANCGHFNESATVCEANNGQLSCKYSTEEKCHLAKCSDYTESLTSCEANDGTMSCKFTEGPPNTCTIKSCSFYNPASTSNPTAEENATCLAADGKLKCKIEEFIANYWTCTEKECEDYSESKAVCDGGSGTFGSCRFTAGTDGQPNTCVRARCGDYADSDSCTTNNGQLECFWNDTHTPDKCYEVLSPCLQIFGDSKSACEGAPAKYNCVWSSFWEMCGSLSCGTFNQTSQAACENAHPECHFSGDKCVEGSGASAMSVSPLVMLLLLFAAVFVF